MNVYLAALAPMNAPQKQSLKATPIMRSTPKLALIAAFARNHAPLTLYPDKTLCILKNCRVVHRQFFIEMSVFFSDR